MIQGLPAKPFLKYPGNKYRLGDKIWEFMKLHDITQCNRFIEPFCGSMGLSLYLLDKLDCRNYYGADTNIALIETLNSVLMDLEEVLDWCSALFSKQTKEDYLETRKSFNWLLTEADVFTEYDPAALAAYFIYLNKVGYKGLVRFNKDGEFNVPYGDGKKASIPLDAMRRFAEAGDVISVQLADYKTTLSTYPERNSVYYLDPPYYSSKPGAFTSYNGETWDEADHVELLDYAFSLKAKGAKVLYSNNNEQFILDQLSDASDILQLSTYRGFRVVDELKATEILALL